MLYTNAVIRRNSGKLELETTQPLIAPHRPRYSFTNPSSPKATAAFFNASVSLSSFMGLSM